MNPTVGAIVYAALHQRITCSHCGSLDHHKRVGENRFVCKYCRKEFNLAPSPKHP
ncbi:hypothetical protein [Geomesophilobacter sediminis]|uniref:Transposase zinc-ribbon domain-containing protein n=1 Tax=Geomesophilobacter sediminis TaxID=2798584 RepID=A0A8J7JKT1_9BACT|nr:hypothetical protein [Geomesophilobacter sediminis]MBJ6725040.1 hypothetical protein [Geomesophilobacter sediminis]